MGDEVACRTSCERLSRNGWWLGLAVSPILAALGLLAMSLAGGSGAPALYAPLCALIGVFFAVQVWRDNPSPRRSTGRLGIGPLKLRWDGEDLSDRDEIHRASYHREGQLGTVVRLHRKGATDLRLLVKSDDDARDLMAEIGFGPDRSTMTFVGQSRIYGMPHWLRSVSFAALVVVTALLAIAATDIDPAHASALFYATMIAGALVGLVLALAPTTIEVGADALAIRWLGRSRIIPLASVDFVEATVQIERLRVTRGGRAAVRRYEAVELMAHRRAQTIRFGQSSYDIAQRDQLVSRIAEAKSALARGDSAMDTAFLARGDRDVPAWIESLRGAGSAIQGGMRIAPVPMERFERLIADASAGAVDRAAAAIAIARVASPEQRQRIRTAAQQTVDPTLRIALSRAAEDEADDEALAEALGALERRHA